MSCGQITKIKRQRLGRKTTISEERERFKLLQFVSAVEIRRKGWLWWMVLDKETNRTTKMSAARKYDTGTQT